MVITTIECRRTGKGAYTHAEVLREPAKVKKFGHSASGNHWREEIVIGDGGLVFLTDISNSGKHRCCTILDRPLAEVEAEFGELPCGLPARLHIR